MSIYIFIGGKYVNNYIFTGGIFVIALVLAINQEKNYAWHIFIGVYYGYQSNQTKMERDNERPGAF